MNILILNASPVKNGRISSVLKEMYEVFLSKGHKVERLDLTDMNIKDCTGCFACQKTASCVIRNDDICIIEDLMQKSDLYVIASPTHWGNMSAVLLRVFERLFGFLIQEQKVGAPKPMKAKGKRAILVTSCSTPSPVDFVFNQSRGCFSRIKEICLYSGIKVEKTFKLSGTITMGDVPEKKLSEARRLASKI